MIAPPADVRRFMFLQALALIAALHPDPRHDRMIEIATRLRRTNKHDRWHSRWFTSFGVAADYAVDEAEADAHEVYVGPNPRRQMRSLHAGRREDIACVTSLPADFDRRHQQDPRPAISFLTQADIPPSIIVESGRGTHLYLRLSEELPVDVGAALAERLHLALGGDAVHDPRRVMRVAGTVNRRNAPTWCHVVFADPLRTYAPARIVAALDAAGVPQVAVEAPVRPAEPVDAPADMERLLARLRRETLHAVLTADGPIIDEVRYRADGGDRTDSVVDYRVISRLIREADATDEQIIAIFSSYAIGEASARRKRPGYLTHTIGVVRRDLATRRLQVAKAIEANPEGSIVEPVLGPSGLWVVPPVDLDALDALTSGPMPPLPPEHLFNQDGGERTN